MLIYKKEKSFSMKLLPLLVFVLLLPIISPITIQPVQMMPYTQSPIIKQHFHLPTTQSNISLPVSTPVHASLTANPIGDEVNIYTYHIQEPAPMGIVDYGISPNGPFTRNTTQWEGKIVIYSLSAVSNCSTAPNSVGFQLNVVLNYEYNGVTYALWVQDTATYNTNTHEIYFEDNIWNSSSPYAEVSGVSGNGGIYPSGNTTYYAYCAVNYPGSFVNLTLPATIYLLVNVTTNSQGQPVIYFWYNDGYGWINYDIVTVTNVVGASNVYFLVDGYKYTPYGDFYDAEMVMTGPYNGASANITNGFVLLQLFYWNGHNFQEIRNAYNFGSDTAETVSNVTVQWGYFQSSGSLAAVLTAGSGSLGSLWNQSVTTQLTVYAPVNSGYVYVYNESIPYPEGINETHGVPFVGGEATLTLYPMDYATLVYQYGTLVDEANIYAGAGQSVSTDTTQFSISVNESQITAYTDESNNVGITINAYGNVTINVISPSSVKTSFTQETTDVNGKDTIDLTIYPTQTGVFTVIVNVSLFPGFYEILEINLQVHEELFTATVEYRTVGQSLPQHPEITLTYPNGTTVTLELYNGETIKAPPNTTYTLQQVINEGNVRWATPTAVSGVINNNGTAIFATYYEQILVNFGYVITNGQWTSTPPTVTYQYFTNQETINAPAQTWVNYDSTYSYSQNITVGDERIVATNYKGTVASPGTVNVYYTLQYYVTVNSPIPVYAIINNMNVSLSTAWYNATLAIQIENLTYYPTVGERYVITSISPSETVVVTSPITIKINTIKQFYVSLSSSIPVYALVNGKNETLESGWYNSSTSIHVENVTYYPTKNIRYVILGIEPSRNVTVTSPTTIKITTLKQYYITVVSTIPVKALINGSQTYLNSSWLNKGTSIYVINYTYYVTKDERYVISGISPQNFIVNSPVTANVSTVKQFLVTINNVSTWYNQGSTITLNANVPIYDVGEFVGTYNVSPGKTITVNSPITETLVLHPNYVFYGAVAGIAVVAVILAVLLTRRAKK